MYFERLRQALPEVRDRIGRACEIAGRSDAEAVELVAVTKGHPIDAVHAAREMGIRIIGENRVGEAEEKFEATGGAGLRWHMVGHLQRNKVRRALEVFETVQSVDSMRLAREIDKESGKAGRVTPVLVQINASGEERKHGFGLGEALAAAGEVTRLEAVRVVGVMTMAPLTDDERVLRLTFRQARAVFDRCRREIERFEPLYLSMGMTNDYEIAVEEGSTMVRLGTALFGERDDDD